MQTPAAEAFDGLFPLETIGSIEQAGLAEGMHEGTMVKVVEYLVLCLLCELVAFSLQPLDKTSGLLTRLFTCSSHEVVNVGTQGIVVLLVITAIYGDGSTKTHIGCCSQADT